MTPDEVLCQLKKHYECKINPYDKRSIVIYNVSFKQVSNLCEKYRCSGSYNEELSIGIILNFGLYQ